MLHHWSDGTGHAQQMITNYSTTYRSTAPSFSGQSLAFEIFLIPYAGDAPPANVQALANHLAFPPLVLVEETGAGQQKTRNLQSSFTPYGQASANLFAEFDLVDAERPYLDWVRAVNQNPEKYGHELPQLAPAKLGARAMLRAAIDGFRGR
jgi:hypothetical protein